MAHQLNDYLPIILVTLVILILGCWNPRATQAKDASGNPKGYQSTNWIAFWVLVIGLIACAAIGYNHTSYTMADL